MILRRQAFAPGAICAGALALLTLGACTPTVRVEVAPINIYAKLDADVRLRLDEDVKNLIQKNPELF
ncbi:YnbE family lipoprotein [Phenylobacterium sp. VNQ135]|uniref:YnbE family lipoprotein n=1 Tax=Phenylobacterium sp. VNQ135 TaxID=3400922 RepID=UPI003C021B76